MKHDHILIRNCHLEGPDARIGVVIAEPHPTPVAHKEWFDGLAVAAQDEHLEEHLKAAP